MSVERLYSDLVLYRRLLKQARRYWRHIGALFVLSLLATPLTLLTPLPLKIAVDSVLGSEPLPGFIEAILPDGAVESDTAVLGFAAVLLVFTAAATQLRSAGDSVLRKYTGEKVVLAFRGRLFRHVQRLSLSYHDSAGTTDATYRVQYDAPSIQRITVDGVIPFISAAITVAAMVFIIFRIDARLAAIALVITPILVILTWLYRRRLRQRHREAKRLESAAMSVVQETLGALRVVKAFAQEEREQERFVDRATASTHAQIRIALVDGVFAFLVGLTSAVGTAAVLFVGVEQVQAEQITLGDLLLIMGYLTMLYAPLSTIAKNITSLQRAFVGAERAYSLLDLDQDVPERPDARPLRRARGSIVFNEVSFAYVAGRQILTGISFEVEPGQRVGIAGVTGAGKTTLVSLLNRFYDPTTGAIFLDGCDLRQYRLADLRRQFGIVLQEPVLFSTSVAENIRYAHPAASFDDVVEAAKAAQIHEFIAALPDGYETLVGERGMRLSGGERQRISVARAFLRNAPILLLDEPTSAVDVRTEAAMVRTLRRLMAGRTCFLITHRQSPLEGCDLVLTIEDGQISSETASTRRDPRLLLAGETRGRER